MLTGANLRRAANRPSMPARMRDVCDITRIQLENLERQVLCKLLIIMVVPEEGVEPTRPCDQRILSPPRLPFRHSGSIRILGYIRNNGNRPVGARHDGRSGDRT